jgi:hypothetical protein
MIQYRKQSKRGKLFDWTQELNSYISMDCSISLDGVDF